MAKVVMSDLRKKVLAVLEDNKAKGGKPMTLKQIAEVIGVDKLSSGTTNAMINAGLISKKGTTKVQVVSYREVETYALGDVSVEDLEKGDNK